VNITKMIPLGSLVSRRVRIRTNRYPSASIRGRYHGEDGTIISADFRLIRVLVLMDGRSDIDESRCLPARTLTFHRDDLELI